MKFDDLDGKMRVFETAHDHCVLPGIYIVARLDGRGFTGSPRKFTTSRPRSMNDFAMPWWKRSNI